MSRVLQEWTGAELIYIEPQQVVKSFGYTTVARRTPNADAYRRRVAERVTEADGEVAEQRTAYSDPSEAATRIKTKATQLGADKVGITNVDPFHVYDGEDVPHRHAIVIAVAMDYDAIRQSPNMISSEETLHIYDATGQIATDLARFIRNNGYPARAQTMKFEQLNMLPHAYAAGLGELGKHGSLINRDLGCSFRLSIVTTDLPMALDQPRLEGIDEVCSRCRMCVDYCPGDAIDHEKEDVRGSLRWVIDTEACAPYWGSYYACGICIAVCPFNAKAFDRRFKDAYVQTIKSRDRQEWQAELEAGLQAPWTHVEQPTETGDLRWRQKVKSRDT